MRYCLVSPNVAEFVHKIIAVLTDKACIFLTRILLSLAVHWRSVRSHQSCAVPIPRFGPLKLWFHMSLALEVFLLPGTAWLSSH